MYHSPQESNGVPRTFSDQDKHYLTLQTKQNECKDFHEKERCHKFEDRLFVSGAWLAMGSGHYIFLAHTLPLPHSPVPYQVDLEGLTMRCQQIEQS